MAEGLDWSGIFNAIGTAFAAGAACVSAKYAGKANDAVQGADKRLAARELINAAARVTAGVVRAKAAIIGLRSEWKSNAVFTHAAGGSPYNELMNSFDEHENGLATPQALADSVQATHSTLLSASLDDLSAKTAEMESAAHRLDALCTTLDSELADVRDHAQDAAVKRLYQRPGALPLSLVSYTARNATRRIFTSAPLVSA
jgi:hypothetical protein